MMKEQAKKAEELIRTIVNQAKVHCRRDTLWQRLQQNPSPLSLNYSEFCELLTLSYTEPISAGEPLLIPLLAQPVSWYQGLAKLLLTRYPDTQRHFSSPDGSSQHVVILNQRLPATAMMLSWDLNADKAVIGPFFLSLSPTRVALLSLWVPYHPVLGPCRTHHPVPKKAGTGW